MAQKDDEYAATHATRIEAKPARLTLTGGRATIVGSATATSMTDAVASVTSNSMRADMEVMWAQLEAIEPKTNALMAKGSVTPKDLGIGTSLPPEITKDMALRVQQTQELQELREHEKDVATINASGPMKAQIANRVLTGIGVLLAILIAWAVGKYHLLG